MTWNWKVFGWSLAVLAAIFAVIFLIACGGGGSGQSSGGTTPNPVPSITNMSPTFLPAGSSSQMLTINGSGFIPSSSVIFNGSAHPATLVSSQQLTITLSQSDLAMPGNFPVAVTNPPPGGGTSANSTFSVWTIYKDQGLGIQINVPPQYISYRSTDPSSNQVVFVEPPAQSEEDAILLVSRSPLPQGESLMQTLEDGGVDTGLITSTTIGSYSYLSYQSAGQANGTWGFATVLAGNQVLTFSTGSSTFATSPELQDIIGSLTLPDN